MGEKTQQPFSNRFCSKRKFKHINPSSITSSTRDTTTIVAKKPYQGSAPTQGVAHKREIPKE
jgi:hypothetical protein